MLSQEVAHQTKKSNVKCVQPGCQLNHLDYQYKDLDAPANAQLRRWFEIEDIKTVPQIFVIEGGSSELVGGYEDFEKYLSTQA